MRRQDGRSCLSPCLLLPAVGAAACSCSTQESCRLSGRPALPPGWAFLHQDPGSRICPPTTLPSLVSSTPHAKAGTLLLDHGQLWGQSLALPWHCHLPWIMHLAGVSVGCWGVPRLMLSIGNSAPSPRACSPTGKGRGRSQMRHPQVQVGAPPYTWALPAQPRPEPRCPCTSRSPATPPCPPAPVTAVPTAPTTCGSVGWSATASLLADVCPDVLGSEGWPGTWKTLLLLPRSR